MSPNHSLKSIRLNYPVAPPPPIPAQVLGDEQQMRPTALKDRRDVKVEDLIIIRRLRVPRYPEDAAEEADIFSALKQSGPHGLYTRRCWREWYDRPDVVNRINWGFNVQWEEKGEGLGLKDSKGVVLVLTCPGK